MSIDWSKMVTPEQKISEDQERTFLNQRRIAIENAIVEVNGNIYNANERSIHRMASAVLANLQHDDTLVMRWSMANTARGVMTDITLGELREALQLASDKMTELWERS